MHPDRMRDDLLKCTFCKVVNPESDNTDWCQVAIAVYATTRLVLSPEEAQKRYFALLAECGSREEMERGCQGVWDNTVGSSDQPAPSIVAPTVAAADMNQVVSVSSLLSLVNRCDLCSNAATFRNPVPPLTMMTYNNASLGPYMSAIRTPMDLSLVKQLIVGGVIRTLRDLEIHLLQIAANCVMFNAPDGLYPRIARQWVAECLREIHQCCQSPNDDAPSAKRRRKQL